MGVRLALGATPVVLRGALLRQGLFTVAVGAICGIVGAILTGRFLENFVEGAKSADPAILILSILFITLIASASIWVGTRRITHLDITDILRIE
jgi:ABC-type antimicrobial peptide transport system permease subunit